MIRLFAGYDERESAGFSTFVHSVVKHASTPVAITPLASAGVPSGSNTFTLSRFLVPFLCGHKGHAIFADGSDMLALADFAELDAMYDSRFAVQVVKHPEYVSEHARKYVGTEMECAQSNYVKKNWASLAIFNCEHDFWKRFTPDFLSNSSVLDILQFQGLAADQIGAIDPRWNVLVDEGQRDEDAKLLHWTAGIPRFKHYQNARRSADWFDYFNEMIGRKK